MRGFSSSSQFLLSFSSNCKKYLDNVFYQLGSHFFDFQLLSLSFLFHTYYLFDGHSLVLYITGKLISSFLTGTYSYYTCRLASSGYPATRVLHCTRVISILLSSSYAE